MSATVAVCGWIGLILVAHSMCERAQFRRRAPIVLLTLACGLLFIEWTRWDHGQGEAWYAIGMIAAPIVAIFGGAAWGAGKYFGWVELTALPGRAAAVAAGVLLGVLVGTQVRDRRDVPESMRRAEALRTEIVAWQSKNLGRWPDSLRQAGIEPPPTAMGFVSPPPFEYATAASGATISFPLPRGARVSLDLATGRFSEERR
jgi:hypothetical protein